jgi:PucR-like helix-turn-helix protein/diguanylate cyclase with GGDEF domain
VVAASSAALERGRVDLARRLEARRAEIEHAVLTRVQAVSGPAAEVDPEYAEGVRAASAAAVDYGLAVIGRGEERSPPLPPILLSQARMAARSGVGLDTVLRRYFAGHALLGDFLIEEAEKGGLLDGVALQRLLRTQAILFDRLLAAVSEEHRRGGRGRLESLGERRAERVERLLAGELVDASQLPYDLDAHHLAVIGSGLGAEEAIRDLASALDRHILALPRREGVLWAWLGGRQAFDLDELRQRLPADPGTQATLAIGEPGLGLVGWRLSHRQARAAHRVALRERAVVVRYSEVALLAAMLQDDLASASLRQLYLDPLEGVRDGGQVLRETLRAYFAARRNVSSTAAALGVNRQTIANRVRTVEQRLGRSIDTCSVEIEVALRLECLQERVVPPAAVSKT